MRASQQGAAILLMTLILLALALLMVLASYRMVFLHIKQTQSEFIAQQAYWKAMGLAECAFAAAQYRMPWSEIRSACIEEETSALDIHGQDGIYRIRAVHQSHIVLRAFHSRGKAEEGTGKGGEEDRAGEADKNVSSPPYQWLKGSWYAR